MTDLSVTRYEIEQKEDGFYLYLIDEGIRRFAAKYNTLSMAVKSLFALQHFEQQWHNLDFQTLSLVFVCEKNNVQALH